MLGFGESIESFLRKPLVAVLCTMDPQREPHLVPIWFHWKDGTAYMFTNRKSAKWRNLENHQYASLCVDLREPPYASVILSGSVNEVSWPIYDLVLTMALRYYGPNKGQDFADNYKKNSTSTVAFGLTPNKLISTM